jgi:hypothetical protein
MSTYHPPEDFSVPAVARGGLAQRRKLTRSQADSQAKLLEG